MLFTRYCLAVVLTVSIPLTAGSNGAGPTADDIKNATLKALFDDRKFVLSPGAIYPFCMVALKADVEVMKVDVELLDNTGHPIDARLLTFEKFDTGVKTDKMTCLVAKLDEQWMRKAVSAKGTVSVAYRVPMGGTPGVQAWKIEIDRPVSDVRVGPTQEVTLQFVRPLPFVSHTDQRCSVYRLTPGGDVLPDKLSLLADLIGSGDSSAVQPRGAEVHASASFDSKNGDSKICFDVTFPGEVNSLRSTVWLEPPYVSTETAIGAKLKIKDSWGWRALAVLIAYGLALLLTWVVTHFRTRLLHDAKRSALRDRLGAFLAAHPDFGNDASVVLIGMLLDQSTLQDKENDFDSAGQSLTSAESRLTALETAPGTPVPLADMAAEPIRILDPQETQMAGAWLTLLVAKPDPAWTPADRLTWSVDGTEVSSGVNLLRIRQLFTAGRHTVTVSNGSHLLSRDLFIQPPPSRSLLTKLKLTDLLPYAVGFLSPLRPGTR
jgi:hypothetical protein